MILKNKIENEINEINNLYEKANKDLTKSFQKKHEILLKREEILRETLQNKVTKAKEQLENYLAKSNCEIRLSEKIIKGIQKFVNKEKNMISMVDIMILFMNIFLEKIGLKNIITMKMN